MCIVTSTSQRHVNSNKVHQLHQKRRDLNSRLFKKLLEDFNVDYHNLIYCCEVRWISRSEMLTRFYLLRNETGQFMIMQGNPVLKLSDSRWLCDLAFMIDISKHFSKLNIKLQGPNQLLNFMLAKVKSFETKLQLRNVQLQNNNTTHFPSLQEQKPSTTAKYALECEKISETFCERFQNMKSKQMKLDIFATPFIVVAAAAPNNFQHKIIELQTNDTMNSMYLNTPLAEFYQRYVTAADFPILRKNALKYVSLFGST